MMARKWLLTACASLALAGCSGYVPVETAASDAAPVAQASEDRQIADLLARMSLERKVGQLIQPQINSFTPEDMERYRFGSYLNGGNGGPYGDELAPAVGEVGTFSISRLVLSRWNPKGTIRISSTTPSTTRMIPIQRLSEIAGRCRNGYSLAN